MKKLMMALAVALILPSCTKDEPADKKVSPVVNIYIPTDTIEHHATVTFGCNYWSVSHTAMTRATLQSLNLTDLWVFDLMDGQSSPTLLIHQTNEDADFGMPTVTAEYGMHTFYFVASRGESPTVSNTTVSWSKPSDTFWQSLCLTIAPSTTTTHAVSLDRVVSRLRITVTDEVPEGLSVLSITPSHWYYGLDYTTGESCDDRQTARSVNVPASYVGTSGQLVASFFCLSSPDEWLTDITLKATDSDNSTLSQISISDVPMQRNHITAFSGTLFGAGRAISVSADDEWGSDIIGTW